MKFDFNKLKGKEALSGLMQSTVDLGKMATDKAKAGVASMVEKSKSDSYARRLRKYNPLFPDQYKSDNFKRPSIIMIVDDVARRDVDVCEGAMGWLNNDSGSEVLCLYDDAIDLSGVQFIPNAACGAIYCVDVFNKSRYIRTDCIFSKAHEEKLAELKHIAYCIGAKKCIIEINESSANTQAQNKSVDLSEKYKGATAKEGFEDHSSTGETNQRSGRVVTEYQNNNTLQVPELKWFAHADNITQLIEIRLQGKCVMKSETLEISGSTCATMSRNTACAIDGFLKGLGSVTGSFSMDMQVTREMQSKLFFHIEF